MPLTVIAKAYRLKLYPSVEQRKKGSVRRRRQAGVVRKLHVRVADCRRDAQHKASRALVDRASAIVIEDLSLRGMAKNRRLALSLADAGLGELRRQLTYKAQWAGKAVVVADRFFPSTQACSHCGAVKARV